MIASFIKNIGKNFRFWLIFYFFLISCHNKSNTGNSKLDEKKLVKDVEKAVWDFHAADTSRNAANVIDLLWPEYTMLVDGNRVNFQDVANGSIQFMQQLELFQTEWSDLDIIPLSSEIVISSFKFRDSIITKKGEVIETHGPTTMIWQKRAGIWKAIYGDSDHYTSE